MKTDPSGVSMAVLLVALAAALGGCAGSRTGWVSNESDTVMRVRFWCGARAEGDRPESLVPGDVHDVAPGEWVRVRLDSECGFESPAVSIVRMQAEPLGVSFKRVAHYWFELNPPGPYGVRAFGVRTDIRIERDGEGTMVPVPAEHWPQAQPAE